MYLVQVNNENSFHFVTQDIGKNIKYFEKKLKRVRLEKVCEIKDFRLEKSFKTSKYITI